MSFELPPDSDLYPHRLARYRSQENLAANGKPQADTLESTVTNILCDFQTGMSVKGPTGFVLGESDNQFTLDELFVGLDADLRTGDVVTQTTGPETGRWWLVRGDAQVRSEFAQYQKFFLSRLPKAPAWVP